MKRASNDWKCLRFRLPILGTLLLLALASPVRAGTVDVAAARAWLDARFAELLSNTSTPARVLALAAWTLDEQEKIDRAAETLVHRQRNDGTWADPSSAGALADQAFALASVAARSSAPAAERGIKALLAAQGRDGGWSSSLSRKGFEDTLSTALAVYALTATRPLVASPEIDVALQRARTFVASRQDPDTGLLGDESRGLGHWSSTAAGLWVLETGGDPRDLATRRATTALLSGTAFARPARQPFYGLFFLRLVASNLPEHVQTSVRRDVLSDLAQHQTPNGAWPASRLQNDADETQATALLLAACRLFETPVATTPVAPKIAWRAVGDGSQLLITLPAEPADLVLVDRRPATNPIVVGYDTRAVEAALLNLARTTNEGWKPWARALDECMRSLHAGPIASAAMVDFVGAGRPLEPLLSPDDVLAELDHLDHRAEQHFARQLSAMPAERLFAEARRAWAHEDEADLTRRIEAAIPQALRPAVTALRMKAAERLQTRCRQGPCCILMEAWLALGPDGVLARMRANVSAADKPTESNHPSTPAR